MKGHKKKPLKIISCQCMLCCQAPCGKVPSRSRQFIRDGYFPISIWGAWGLSNEAGNINPQGYCLLRPRPHGAETGENYPVSFYAVQEYLRKDGSHCETAPSCRNAVLNIQGAGSPQKKEERIKLARIQPAPCYCIQTFSHEEIQPFKLCRNTF